MLPALDERGLASRSSNAPANDENSTAAMDRLLPEPAAPLVTDYTNHRMTPLHSPEPSAGQVRQHALHNRLDGYKAITRNIDRVYFGTYDIKTWYYSPYPFDDEEWQSLVEGNGSSNGSIHAHPLVSERKQKQSTSGSSTPTSELSQGGRMGGALSATIDRAPALQGIDVSPPLQVGRLDQHTSPPAKALWICDGCFKYMRTYGAYTIHKKDCKQTHPPGKKVYQRGAHILWKVDGAAHKLYAQNLSLFGKLFIDHKTIYFDVEPFTFYVLTDASSHFDHVLGFFSKEKVSYDDYNLACIIVFPPYQKKGFGMLMIEFSYYLSSTTSVLGTPERPLSDLGFRGYLSYWCSVLLRTLALYFDDQDASVTNRLLPASQAFVSPGKYKQSAQTVASHAAMARDRQKREVLRIRKTLLGLSVNRSSSLQRKRSESSFESSGDGDRTDQDTPSRKSMKGWAGEMPRASLPQTHLADSSDLSKQQMPISAEYAGKPKRQISPQSLHPLLQMEAPVENDTELITSLERLSIAANIRVDDITFALSEMGFLQLTRRDELATSANALEDRLFVVTKAMVRAAIERYKVKRPVLDVDYILP